MYAHVLMNYHIIEEMVIGIICLIIACSAFSRLAASSRPGKPTAQPRRRVYLFAAGFLILGASSSIHTSIHFFAADLNLLYQTLVGYVLGLFMIAISFAVGKSRKIWLLPLVYLPTLLLLLPPLHSCLPYFGEFRPMMWISVAYLAGVAAMLFFASYYLAQDRLLLVISFGFSLVCVGSIFLFFPSSIGSPSWLIGHLFRPLGFVIILAGYRKKQMELIGSSILYRALTAFSLLSSLPVLFFGSFVFYQNIAPIHYLSEKMILFLLLLVTLAAALFFGLGMIIRLVKPIVILKKAVEGISRMESKNILEVNSTDEIGQLAESFNNMFKRLNNAIEEQQHMCRLAATGELAATLAHEIKNPLNAISVSSQYIKKNYKGKLIEEFLNVINDEVSRINKLTSALLTFARPVQPNLEINNINRIVMDTVELLGREMEEQKIKINVDCDETIPLILCDANQVKQIVINLFINAQDAMKEGGVITIRTCRQEKTVRIDITDTGPGIALENTGKIFNPFFTTKTRGTGLGLAISRSIAREHGGDLTVQSTPGAGTTFTLYLS